MPAHAVGVRPRADNRVPREPARQRADRPEDPRAPARPVAHRPPGRSQRRRRLALQRVERVVEGGVDHHGPGASGMAHGEHLGGVGAVGVAVDVDLRDVEPVQDRGHVVGNRSGPVGARRPAEPPRTRCGGGRVGRDPGLQRRAIDGSRRPRAALVHQDQVVPAMNLPEHEEVGARRADRPVSRAALEGHDRLQRRSRAVSVADDRIADGDPAEPGVVAIERHADRRGVGRRRGQSDHRQGGRDQHADRIPTAVQCPTQKCDRFLLPRGYTGDRVAGGLREGVGL